MGDQKQGNGNVVGEVLKGAQWTYPIEAAGHADKPTETQTRQFMNDVEIGLEHANHFARSVNDLSVLRREFNLVSARTDTAYEVNGRLAENSAALDDNLNRTTSHLSRPEASKFRQEFMKHHDLMQTTDRDGNKIYVENPDPKQAQKGDFVVKPNFFAPGNQL